MIRIAISQAAFDAICATLPFGSVSFENKLDEHGQRLIWLERRMLDLAGRSANAIAVELNKRGVATPTGSPWSAKTVSRVQRRLEAVT
jgi:hypothetical protein